MIYHKKLDVTAGTPAVLNAPLVCMEDCDEHVIQVVGGECTIAVSIAYAETFTDVEAVTDDTLVLDGGGITGIRFTATSGTVTVNVAGN